MNVIKLPIQINSVKLNLPRMDLYYPQVCGLMNIAVQQRINAIIANLVYMMNKQQGYYENPLTQVTGSFEIKTNQRGILSLSLINYAYSGGAHGMTIIKSLTFDVTTGEVYPLKDLFEENSDYVMVLSNIIKEQIKERDIMLLDEFTQIRPNQDYYIADKALVIYFQLYEITPYAFGFPNFPISIYEIEDIIADEGPLGKMFGSF